MQSINTEISMTSCYREIESVKVVQLPTKIAVVDA